jgi:hypothetical protein
MAPETAQATAANRGTAASLLQPICERLLAALDCVRREHNRDSLRARATLRHAVTAYVRTLRAEGISSPWVLESVIAFARGCRPSRAALVSHDPVEADIVRWSLAALEWPEPATR